MRRDLARRAACAAAAFLCLLPAACAAPVAAVGKPAAWTLVVVTAARGQGIRIDRIPVASAEACSAIEQVVTTMRDAGVDRTTTARCEPRNAAI